MIHAPADQLYELLVDPELFVQWMADDADARPGPRRHRSAGPTPTATPARAPTSSSIPGRRVVFTYGWERAEVQIPPGSTTVEIDLLPQPDGTTLLKLVHRGLDDLAADAHHGGWTPLPRPAPHDRRRHAHPGPDPFVDRRVPTPEELASHDRPDPPPGRDQVLGPRRAVPRAAPTSPARR